MTDCKDRYPEGAIKTKQELEKLTTGRDSILFLVSNGNYWGNTQGSSMDEIKFSKGSQVLFDKSIKAYFFYGQKHKRFSDSFSLRDTNIDGRNGYNDHFVFHEKEMAESYLIAAKAGWHTVASRF